MRITIKRGISAEGGAKYLEECGVSGPNDGAMV